MPRSYQLDKSSPKESPILPAYPSSPPLQTVSTSPGLDPIVEQQQQQQPWQSEPSPSTSSSSQPSASKPQQASAISSPLVSHSYTPNFIEDDHDCVLNHHQLTNQSDYTRCPVCCRSISSTSGSSYTSTINSTTDSIRKRHLSIKSESDFPNEPMKMSAPYSSGDDGGQIRISRDPINLTNLEQFHQPVKQPYHAPRRTIHRLIPDKFSFLSTLTAVFPILKWLPKYDVKADLTSDIIAGITVLALQIPQGLAYSKLAGVAPIYGLYATFFSMVVYSFMGTSRHVSMGLYAITSMMCRNVIQGYTGPAATGIEILITLCFMTGILQFVFGVLRLGNLSLLFSDNFLSAFTVGCAVLIFNSQVPPTLGIDFPVDENAALGIPSDCINSWISIVRHIPESNTTTLILSAIVISSLCLCKYYLEPYILVQKYNFQFPIPIDLIVIIVTTLISTFIDLNLEYGVATVGQIPSGFAAPAPPRMDIMGSLFMNAIIMAVVASVCQVSLAKIAAKKYGYSISLNQEFLAYGSANIFCSFFYCFPTCASLARTSVNENAGARSQLSAILCSGLLVLFLLFFTAYLGPLPKASLSGIIIVAMIPSYVKAKDFIEVAKVSRFDAVLWMITFLTVTFLGVNIGILCGLVTSIVIILLRVALPTSTIKYPIEESELYLSPEVYQGLNERTLEQYRVAVFNFQGPLTFLSAATFKSDIRSKLLDSIVSERAKIELDTNNNKLKSGRYMSRAASMFEVSVIEEPRPEPKEHNKEENGEVGIHFGVTHHPAEIVLNEQVKDSGLELTRRSTKYRLSTVPPPRPNQSISTLILDMTQMTYIDMTGICLLTELKDELEDMQIQLLLANCSVSALSTLERAKFFRDIVSKDNCFLSVHDAVVAAKHYTTYCFTEHLTTKPSPSSPVLSAKRNGSTVNHEDIQIIENGISL